MEQVPNENIKPDQHEAMLQQIAAMTNGYLPMISQPASTAAST